MADIRSINGNPIVLDSSGIGDGSVTEDKLADGAVGLGKLGFGGFHGGTSSQSGTEGLVPAPSYDDRDNVLWGNGAWGSVNLRSIADSSKVDIMLNKRTETPFSSIQLSKVTIPSASSSSAGLMSSEDKEKLESIASDDGIKGYVDEWLDEHPEATTTVQDGSVTLAKLSSELASSIPMSPLTDAEIDAITQ